MEKAIDAMDNNIGEDCKYATTPEGAEAHVSDVRSHQTSLGDGVSLSITRGVL